MKKWYWIISALLLIFIMSLFVWRNAEKQKAHDLLDSKFGSIELSGKEANDKGNQLTLPDE